MALFNNGFLRALLFALPSIASPLNLGYEPLDVKITLTNVSYSSNTAFWGPGSVRLGSANVAFTISSPEFPNIHCAALTSDGGYNDAYFKYIQPTVYHCDTSSGGSGSLASFIFSRFDNQITVNQTWDGSQTR